MRWLKSGWITLVFLLVLFPAVASGHAYLERSNPLQDSVLEQSPTEIRLTFTEEIDPRLSRIVLEDEQGNAIDGKLTAESDSTLVYEIPFLENGVYKVKWQVLSVDTHVTEGSFRFAVAVPLEKERPRETISLDGEEPAPGPDISGAKEPTDGTAAPASPELPASPATSEEEQKAAGSGSSEDAGMPAHAGIPATNETPADGKPASPPVPPSTLEAEEAFTEEADVPPGAQEAAAAADPPSGREPQQQEGDRQAEREEEDRQEIAAFAPPPAEDSHDHHDHHGHHDGAHHHGGWRAKIYQWLRIAELLAAAGIGGFLFFRYGIARNFAPESLPGVFSNRGERRLLAFAFLIFAATGAIRVSLLTGQLSGMGTDTGGEIFRTIVASTMTGGMAWLRPVLTLLLLVPAVARKEGSGWPLAIRIVAVLALFVSFPLTGHAFASSSGAAYAVFSHLLHLLVASVWFGGLLGILAATWPKDMTERKWTDIQEMVRRFSRVALPVVLIMGASGIGLALLRLKSWSALIASGYGRLVLAKTLLLLLVVAIGAWHRLALIPRMTAAASGTESGGGEAAVKFVRVLRLEVVLALVAIGVAGVLSTTAPPPEQIRFEPVYWHVMGEEAHLTFRMNAERDGQWYRLDIWLPTGTGAPENVEALMTHAADPATRFAIPFEYRTGGPDPYGFEGFDKYTYDTRGNWLTESGEWIVLIRITDSLGQLLSYENRITLSN